MLPGMIEVETGVIASGVVPNPFAVVVDVRGFGMAFPVAIRVGRRSGRCATSGRWTVARNISAADRMAASSMTTVLREGWDAKNQRYCKSCGK